MKGRMNVAIDGPAGAGKSTIAKEVARRLGILYLDTGAMYRAAALKAIRCGVEPGDAQGVLPLLAHMVITVKNQNGVQRTYLDGEDVSSLIRTQEVSQGASDIGVIPEVRRKLVETQRQIAKENDVVMEGRDMGSYVIPQTPYKFYVTASSLERARRRHRELQQAGKDLEKTLEEIQREIEHRDQTDSTRAFAPLTRTPDAILIDTTQMDIETAVCAVLAGIAERERE